MHPARAILRRPVVAPLHPLAIALWERDVTFADFAEALGVSERAIKHWVTWKRRPRRADRERMARELGGDYFPPLVLRPSKGEARRALRPFFKFFGGKHRIAARYPAPEGDTIVEPFAGSAGYSTLYHDRNVVLVERDAEIASVWRYLIRAKPAEIRRLPLLRLDQTLDDLRRVPPEARALIGFWLRSGSTYPRKKPGAWMRSEKWPDRFWGEKVRERIASQVDRIKHWRIVEGSYEQAPDVKATWFIDPPYEVSGKSYRHGSNAIDYRDLARWVHERKGLVIACEQAGARWLPFRFLATAKANRAKGGDGVSNEVVYVSRSADENPARPELDDEQIGAVLRAIGVDRRTALAMLEARYSSSSASTSPATKDITRGRSSPSTRATSLARR